MRQRWEGTRWPLAVAMGIGALGGLAGCSDVVRNTELVPEGPPEILQVLAQERDGDEVVARIAFGDHPDVDTEADDLAVDLAVAGGQQRIRIVVDELLRGNALEEVLCADDTWSRVPVGTDGADIARCAGVDLSKCTAVCVGVGIMDVNGDRGFDDTRLIDGVAKVVCDGVEIGADVELSYYQPSGNQLVPAGPLGLEGLGPALVIVPRDALPTGARCKLALDASVVDRDGVQPCAASDGGCAPGDLQAIEFGVEPLLVLGSDPADGAEAVAPSADPVAVTVQLNVPVDEVSLAAGSIVATAGGADVPVQLRVDADDPSVVIVELTNGTAPATAYELSLTAGAAGVADPYGGALVDPVTVRWMTSE